MSAIDLIGRAFLAVFIIAATLILASIAVLIEAAPVVFALLLAMLIARWWGLL